MSLKGKVIVVAGGRGHLGSAICAGLREAKARAFVPSSELTFPNEIEEELAGLDQIDGVINCAGRGMRGAALDVSPRDFMDAIERMVAPAYNVICAALPHLLAGSSIVNVVSMWAFVAPDPRTYLDLGNDPSVAGVAAAGALRAMTRHYASLLASRNIRVNALVPGWFPKKRGPDRLDYIEQITSRVPMGRIGQPQELVDAALMLLTSTYMTGQEIIVDGGYSCR